jgi:hypothetical protein
MLCEYPITTVRIVARHGDLQVSQAWVWLRLRGRANQRSETSSRSKRSTARTSAPSTHRFTESLKGSKLRFAWKRATPWHESGF